MNHSGLHLGCHSFLYCESAKLMDEHNLEIAVRAAHCQPSGPYMFPVIKFWNACHFLYCKQTVFISITVEYGLCRRRRKQYDVVDCIRM